MSGEHGTRERHNPLSTSPLARIGFGLVVTGVACLFMSWGGVLGALLLITGSACTAIALETWLDADPERILQHIDPFDVAVDPAPGSTPRAA